VPSENRSHPLKNPSWVTHDGIIYYFCESTIATLQNDTRTGNWWHINHSFPKDEITKDVFTLCIEHGSNPVNDHYSYIVSIPENKFNPRSLGKTYKGTIELIANTDQIQAVYNKDLHISGIVFYEQGSVQLSKTLKIGVDRKCLVMVREDGDFTEISVSNPENKQCTVNVTVGRKTASDRGSFPKSGFGTVIPFDLPGGIYAGKTLTLREREFPMHFGNKILAERDQQTNAENCAQERDQEDLKKAGSLLELQDKNRRHHKNRAAYNYPGRGS